jgi:uncharacterized protein
MEHLTGFSDTVWLQFLVLFLTGAFSGCVDAIAGGGGLISMPVLLNMGLPPIVTLGTGKMQAVFGSFTSSIRYLKLKEVTLKEAFPGIVTTAISAILGTLLIQQFSAGFLKYAIPFLLLAITVYTILSPDLGKIDTYPKFPIIKSFIFGGLIMGFYDGFFGPGTGNFWVIILMYIAGFNMLKATGYTKILNFTSNLCSCVLFLVAGKVAVEIALVMALGQIIGARIGAGLAAKRGIDFIRPVFISVALILTVNLFYRLIFK